MKCSLKWGKKCVSVCTSFLSSFLFSLPYFYCRIMFPFLLFPRLFLLFFVVVCLFLSWFGCVLFFLLFFFFLIHPCLSGYRSLHSSIHIYAYTYAYWVFIRPGRSFLPFPFSTSSIVLTCNPRSNPGHGTSVIIPASAVCISHWVLIWILMWAGSKREAGSQRKEQDKTTTCG